MKKWFTCLGNLSWENSTVIISLRDNFHIKVSKLLQSLVPGIKKKKKKKEFKIDSFPSCSPVIYNEQKNKIHENICLVWTILYLTESSKLCTKYVVSLDGESYLGRKKLVPYLGVGNRLDSSEIIDTNGWFLFFIDV